MVAIILLALMYLTGFGFSVGYISRPDHKRALITSGVVVMTAIVIVASAAVFGESYDGLIVFLAACTGLALYLLFVSLAALIGGLTSRSGTLISAGSIGLGLCLILFIFLKGIVDQDW